MEYAKTASGFFLAAALIAALPSPGSAAFRYFDPERPSAAPKLISATGFYDNTAAKQVTAAAVPFTVNTPLWSDGAGKRRWVLLKPGARIRFADVADYYTYPDSTVFVQEITLDTVPGDSSSRILLETRFLILKKNPELQSPDFWFGFSYRWNRQGTDANLVDSIYGDLAAVRYYPGGRNRPAQLKKWRFPSQGQCALCHINSFTATQSRGVLGFFTAQLNRTEAGGQNQLTRLFNAGVFQAMNPMPDFASSPKWAPLTDNSATLELRARSYLAANCSGCHGDRGIPNSATGHGCKVNFDYFDMKKPEEMGTKRVGALEYQVTSTGNPETADNNAIVKPGHPEFSSIIWRLQAVNDSVPSADTSNWTVDPAFDQGRYMMPPLGRYEQDTTALRILAEWIRGAGPVVPITVEGFRRGRLRQGSGPRVAGGLVILEGMRIPAKAWLVDTRGVGMPLAPSGEDRYRLPVKASPGVYNLMLGDGRAYRIVLP